MGLKLVHSGLHHAGPGLRTELWPQNQCSTPAPAMRSHRQKEQPPLLRATPRPWHVLAGGPVAIPDSPITSQGRWNS